MRGNDLKHVQSGTVIKYTNSYGHAIDVIYIGPVVASGRMKKAMVQFTDGNRRMPNVACLQLKEEECRGDK
jgi:hypothetical protein